MSNTTSDVKRVAVVGTGVIGASWAAYFLARGLDVDATDPSPGAEARLREAVAQHWPTMERFGLADGASPERLRFHAAARRRGAPGRLRAGERPRAHGHQDRPVPPHGRGGAAGHPARVELVGAGDQRACSPAAAHPERVVLGHPFNPPHLIPLVEVVGGEQTSAEAIERAMAFYARHRQAADPRPSARSRATSRTGCRRRCGARPSTWSTQGVATVADIDTAIAHGPGLRWALMGPFMNLHLSGGAGGIAHLLDAPGRADRGLVARPRRALDDGRTQAARWPKAWPTNWAGAAAADLEAARDTLLLDLIRAKAASAALD